MKFNKAQLHLLYYALGAAVDWETTLADSYKTGNPDAQMKSWRRQAEQRVLQFSNLRDFIGRELRGENK